MEWATSTLEQLPRNAAEYYAESTESPRRVFDYKLVGKDRMGRRVYQKYLSGAPYGRPKALLTYTQFRAAVLHMYKLCPRTAVGVPRWSHPCGDEWMD